jgi:threonyl-tRNA synthetase
MANISIVVDGKPQSVDSETKPTQIFSENPEIVVCKVNGDLKDLWTDLKDGDDIEGISIESPDGLAVLRHSTAHVLAQAVQEVFADTKLGI